VTTLDVPCDGRATFHRMGVRALRDSLLADEERHRHEPGLVLSCTAREIIATYLRPAAYVLRGIGA
jgi:hypothetical protein